MVLNQGIARQGVHRACGETNFRAPFIALSTLLLAGACAIPAEADPQASSSDTTAQQGSLALTEIVVTAEAP